MPNAPSGDIRLYYEETGDGYPILFIHEFAGDHSSWEPQLRYFSRRYRCIAYNARGYPPSDVPENPEHYSQDHAVGDAIAVLDHLGIARAHIVGLSMGGFCTVHFGLRHGARARSLLVAGCGYGAPPRDHAEFSGISRDLADRIEREGWQNISEEYAQGPTRLSFKRKSPRGWREFADKLATHSSHGAMMHMRHVQGARPSLWDFEDELKALAMPVLVVNGDEDTPCLETGLWLKRTIPGAGHWVLPNAGHTMNIEEPELFNLGLERFLAEAEARSPA
jgi:pimeloyl-ACP methyl ester carboxylesterase